MAKIKLTKKAKIGLGVLAGLLACALLVTLVILLLNIFKVKTYDIEELKTIIVAEYEDLYLTEMDHIDVLDAFGFAKSDVEDSIFLKSLQMDSEGNDVTEEINYVIVINTEDYQYYYDIFESHVDSTVRYTEDNKLYKLYNKAIIKCDKNYVYLIISSSAKDIEKTINE